MPPSPRLSPEGHTGHCHVRGGEGDALCADTRGEDDARMKRKTFFLPPPCVVIKGTLMRWILQLGLMVLMLLGAGNRAWGRASASPEAVEWDSSPSRTFDHGVDAPPRRLASGEAAAWGLDVASAGADPLDSTPTTAGPVVVTFHGTAFLMCPGAPPPVIGSFRTLNPAWVAVGPNVYAYVKQNPWTAFDPEGLSAYSDLTDSAAKDLSEDRPIRGYAKAVVSSLWEAFSFGNASKMGDVQDSYEAGDISAGQAAWQATAGTATAVKDAALTYGTGGAVLKLANKYDKVETLVNVATNVAEGDYAGAALGVLGEVAPGGKKSKGVDAPGAKGQRQNAVESNALVDAATTGKTHGHHSDTKFMGGDSNQKLTTMPENQHKQLHRDLNDHLVKQTDEFGNHMRPQRGNPGTKIRENFTDDQRRDAMADFYKQSESKYPDAAKDFFDQHPDRK